MPPRAQAPPQGTYGQFFAEGKQRGFDDTQALFYGILMVDITHQTPVGESAFDNHMGQMMFDSNLSESQKSAVIQAIESRTGNKITNQFPAGPKNQSFEEEDNLDEIDQVGATESYGSAGLSGDVPGGKAALDFSLNITPANYIGLNPGAGWSGFSPTNEGGIATIDSAGKISWSGFAGLGQIGQAQFASGKDAIAAILGREDSSSTPPGAPPSSPPNSPPDDPGPY